MQYVSYVNIKCIGSAYIKLNLRWKYIHKQIFNNNLRFRNFVYLTTEGLNANEQFNKINNTD